MKLALAVLGFTAHAMKLSHPHTDEELAAAGLANCQCLDDNGIAASVGEDGMEGFFVFDGQCMVQELPDGYGESVCAAHDMGLAATGCDGASPSEACGQEWCYVALECEVGVVSSYNDQIKYSYAACGHDVNDSAFSSGPSQAECAAQIALAAAEAAKAAADQLAAEADAAAAMALADAAAAAAEAEAQRAAALAAQAEA